MQAYDLAWSPLGEYILAGSMDNTARVFAAAEGKCVYEFAEHLHYVQGVNWDPLNEYIATQSSGRSMHIYRISTKPGGAFEAHAVGKNTRIPRRHSHSHSRTPSAHGGGRPRMFRQESTTSDAESSSTFALDLTKDSQSSVSGHGKEGAPLTPATSVGSRSTLAFMLQPLLRSQVMTLCRQEAEKAILQSLALALPGHQMRHRPCIFIYSQANFARPHCSTPVSRDTRMLA
ncbi:hypothetical protein BDZ97DRAFT_1250588 [Flammula alnicola]|nr:hypothetical protein BDZ97DRAFT_1250588 [Flammula alnicola]